MLLSGGVDSAVALTLLRAAGHDCVAFYLQIWFQEDFRNYWDQCPWEDDLAEARAVCDVLGVPLEVVPLTNPYWDLVVSHSIAEIARGRTPNPDMLCNSRVKFGAFREHLETHRPGEFDRVASGHYAALDRGEEPSTAESAESAESGESDESEKKRAHAPAVKLVMSADARKDQTYFLAHLSQSQLASLCFPVGGLPKARLREVARAARLPNAARKDSQGICFLGKVKFSEFVAEHLGERPGAIVELESGDRVGTHAGFWFHTIGQRSGLGLSGGPWYVCGKDVEGNVVYVTRSYYAVDKERNTFRVGEFNWIAGAPPPRSPSGYALGFEGPGADAERVYAREAHPPMLAPDPEGCRASPAAVRAAGESGLFVKVRHGERRYRCTLRFDEEDEGEEGERGGGSSGGGSGTVVIDASDQGLAAGQFAVFYRGEECLGCGVILEREGDARLRERDRAHRDEGEGGVGWASERGGGRAAEVGA